MSVNVRNRCRLSRSISVDTTPGCRHRAIRCSLHVCKNVSLLFGALIPSKIISTIFLRMPHTMTAKKETCFCRANAYRCHRCCLSVKVCRRNHRPLIRCATPLLVLRRRCSTGCPCPLFELRYAARHPGWPRICKAQKIRRSEVAKYERMKRMPDCSRCSRSMVATDGRTGSRKQHRVSVV